MLRQGKIQESLTFGHFWKKLVYFVVFDVWKPFGIDDFCQKQDMKFLMKFRLILPLENSFTISKIYNSFTFECFFNDFLWKENLLEFLLSHRKRKLKHCKSQKMLQCWQKTESSIDEIRTKTRRKSFILLKKIFWRKKIKWKCRYFA